VAVWAVKDLCAGEECLEIRVRTEGEVSRRVRDGGLTPRTAVGKNEAVNIVSVVVILLLRAPWSAMALLCRAVIRAYCNQCQAFAHAVLGIVSNEMM
jgi:hypothetical protein